MCAWRQAVAAGPYRDAQPGLVLGPCDRKGLYQKALVTDPAFTSIISKNLRILPFQVAQDVEGADPPPLAFNMKVLSCYMALSKGMLHLNRVTDEMRSQTISIAECIGMNLPESSAIPQDKVNGVFKLIFNNQFGPVEYQDQAIARAASVTVLTNELFGRISAEEQWNGRNATRRDCGINQWPPSDEEITALNDQQRGQLWWLMLSYPPPSYMPDQVTRFGLESIVYMMVSIAKQGNCTPSFLRKISGGMESDLGLIIDLDNEILKNLYLRYAGGIDDTNIEQILTRYLGLVPDQAMRLGLTLLQSAGTGLTQLHTIGKALKKFPDFNWGLIREILPSDFNASMAAIAAVGNNPWYGYRKNLGLAKSTLFPNIAIVARDLLMRSGSDPSLRHYRGWKKGHLPQENRIHHLINKYLGHDHDPEEFPADSVYADQHFADVPENIVDLLNDPNTIYI